MKNKLRSIAYVLLWILLLGVVGAITLFAFGMNACGELLLISFTVPFAATIIALPQAIMLHRYFKGVIWWAFLSYLGFVLTFTSYFIFSLVLGKSISRVLGISFIEELDIWNYFITAISFGICQYLYLRTQVSRSYLWIVISVLGGISGWIVNITLAPFSFLPSSDWATNLNVFGDPDWLINQTISVLSTAMVTGIGISWFVRKMCTESVDVISILTCSLFWKWMIVNTFTLNLGLLLVWGGELLIMFLAGIIGVELICALSFIFVGIVPLGVIFFAVFLYRYRSMTT